MTRLQQILPIALFLTTWLPMLDAGVLMVNTQEFFDNSRGPSTTKLHVESDRVRIELDGQQTDVIIFRGDRQVMWMLNRSDRTYHELTKADVERMSQQISGAMSEMQNRMQEQLKNMPPEQRKMVEQMMKSHLGAMPGAAAQTSKTEYTKVAGGQQVNQWTCDKYEATRDGQKRRELWTAPPNDLGLDQSDFQVMLQMAEFFKSFTQMGREAPFRVGLGNSSEEPDFSGVPVRQIYFDGGRPSSRSELKEVTRQDFDAPLFELPSGFTKKDMFGGQGNPFQR